MRIGWLGQRIFVAACIVGLTILMWPGELANAQDAILTPTELRQDMAANPAGAEAERLAGRARRMFGRNLMNGTVKIQDGLTLAFGIEMAGITPGDMPHVAFSDGSADLALHRVGETSVYAGVITMPALSTGHWTIRTGRDSHGEGDYELYPLDKASVPNNDVPHGKLSQQSNFRSSIYPQTEREWWIYVPAQYKPEAPACVMIIQDGQAYLGSTPTVVDNLIAAGEMPVTVCVFVNPGKLLPGGTPQGNNQRSFEYDTVSDQYSRFLLEEILPEVEKTVKLRHDAASRCLAGLSSGASCAFTAAWFRPDQFSKVLSWIGSYTDLAAGKTGIEGAHNYPFLIRRTDKKPIRVYLQDGDHDLDNPYGNWPLANQAMASAFKFKGYDYQFVFGHGGHSGLMGTAYLPASLRWLWRDYKP